MKKEYTVCIVVENRYEVKVQAEDIIEAVALTDDLECLTDLAPSETNWWPEWVRQGDFGQKVDASVAARIADDEAADNDIPERCRKGNHEVYLQGAVYYCRACGRKSLAAF